MRINFYPIRNFDPATDAAGLASLGAAGPAGLALGGLQTALGIYQAISGGAKADRLMRKRKAFKTPEEILDLAKFDQSQVGTGLSPQVLQYLTGNADNALSTSLNTAERLGADPNQLSNMLDQRFQQNLSIGAQDQLENMKKFSAYRDSLQVLAANKAAEQKSQEDLLKDQLQAASATQQQAVPNILGGGNTILNTLSSAKIAELFKPQATSVNPLPSPNNATVATVPGIIPDTSITNRFSAPDVSGFNFSQTPSLTPENYRRYVELLNQMNKIKIGQ